MNTKQKILKLAYPVLTGIGRLIGKGNKVLSSSKKAPASFYDLSITLNDGTSMKFSSLRNKKVMIVNTASDCGYTAQYEGLQELNDNCGERVIIIGFPSNDFGAQEKGSDDHIAQFCKVNFGVTFMLSKKCTIAKIKGQHEVYQWLSDENKNGWNNQEPTWNFSKYMIDENGNLTHYFESGIEPMGNEILAAINEKAIPMIS